MPEVRTPLSSYVVLQDESPFVKLYFLSVFISGAFLADLIYSCLPGSGGEHRRKELYQCSPMVWYHRGLR